VRSSNDNHRIGCTLPGQRTNSFRVLTRLVREPRVRCATLGFEKKPLQGKEPSSQYEPVKPFVTRHLMLRISQILICILWLLPAATAWADADAHTPKPLPPRTQSTKSTDKAPNDRRARTGATGWTTTGAAMAAVLGLIFVVAKLVKRNSPQTPMTLPVEVLQVLGRKMLDYRSTIQLVRCGSRLLVVGITQSGMTTLAEITDPVEVDYLAGLCKSSQSASVGETFNQLFRRFQSDADEHSVDEPEVHPATVPIDEHSAGSLSPAEQILRERLRKEAAG